MGIGESLDVLLGIALAVFALASASGVLERERQVPILTEPVVLSSVEETVLAHGVLQAVRTVSVGAPSVGSVEDAARPTWPAIAA
ncbi:hypothetical protein ACFWXH_26045 [Mesorhizobium sp. NPDC059054]|uniref:hypothetical protein n=1 Tax=Mesorhizobium sp. NPDC059054 TaxID=3346711 RepID=UPI0036B2BEC4